MSTQEYIEQRVELEHQLVETHVEELKKTARIDARRKPEIAAFAKDAKKLEKVHQEAEKKRRAIYRNIRKLNNKWKRLYGEDFE